jgi:uncharacterized protein YcfL
MKIKLILIIAILLLTGCSLNEINPLPQDYIS